MAKAQQIVERVLVIHSELLKLGQNLHPGPTINELLGSLVVLCSQIHDQDITRQVLDDANVQAVLPSLRRICAASESCLESHWAHRILEASVPEECQKLLESFPYYGNYEELAKLELNAILSASDSAPKKIAFIGSGPLPLTSLCLLSAIVLQSRPSTADEGPSVLNIDIDPNAIDVSTRLNHALGSRGRGMHFSCAEAGSADQDLSEFDVVYVAALVGMSQADKEDIFIKVASSMRKGSLLVVRSSWGLRTLLYPEVDISTDRLLQCLEPCLIVHPYNQVVNSVVVAKVK
ncbi:Nicotianamine synthase [Bombardia bombarda]|uniref:Nicotianamine synthase n=1 Tax=Bombardia bombarda TaxID=252184 RepID=A0AA40C9H1_9PEZI|nr:Nicotianamine synthase [Bombardia bombarda]